ncbi:MAG TPA: MBOAT family protein, partial [Lentisphaerae bacterium]|nr:MBOAT family protein [Lentisphaerota bacterium]
MLFNSSDFLKFLLAFALAYYLVRNRLRLRNLLVVFASYVFYGWWDWRFLGLIMISTLLDYFVGRGLGRVTHPTGRRLLLAASITGNLLILGFFKYYDFFAASLERSLQMLGLRADLPTLGLVLPVGISFYTFQTMSYSFDVYRRVIPPTRDLAAFAAYVAFFPQLVAGPIERAHRLLPQFLTSRVITPEMLADGVWLFIRGMFKKVVIADSLAPISDSVFSAAGLSAPAVLLGVVAFGVQIY